MVEWLIEPLRYGFFIRGLIAGIAVALSCGTLSAFIVWRGMAFIGDALAHAVLPGIVIAMILGVHILFGALVAALVSVLAIGTITRKKGFREDTAIGVIFTGAFALGIVLMNRAGSFKDLSHILFGSILGVGAGDLYIIGGVSIAVTASVVLFFKELLVTSFDRTHSIAIGLSPALIHYGLLVLIAVTTVISVQTVGVVLVLALLVTPAAASSLLFRDMKRIILFSVGTAFVSVIAGFYASYYLNLASGAAVVLILTILFILCFIIDKLKAAFS